MRIRPIEKFDSTADDWDTLWDSTGGSAWATSWDSIDDAVANAAWAPVSHAIADVAWSVVWSSIHESVMEETTTTIKGTRK